MKCLFSHIITLSAICKPIRRTPESACVSFSIKVPYKRGTGDVHGAYLPTYMLEDYGITWYIYNKRHLNFHSYRKNKGETQY